jgi:hypothetical protein
MPRELLREVIDLEIGINIVGLGLVYDVRLAVGVVAVRMTLTTPGCLLGGYINDAIHQCLRGAPHRRDPAAGQALVQPELVARSLGHGLGREADLRLRSGQFLDGLLVSDPCLTTVDMPVARGRCQSAPGCLVIGPPGNRMHIAR